MALVAAEDYDWLMQWKWFMGADGYAGRRGKRRIIFMHRVVLEKKIDRKLMDGEHVNHINHNRSDNLPENLRLATYQESAFNRKKRDNCSSIHKGVCWHKRHNKWVSHIKIDGKKKYLGMFSDEQQAAIEYNKFATEFFGEFASLNIII